LHTYYGKDFDVLNPEVVLEGQTHAVIRLLRAVPNMISSVGYVLIKKSGSHTSSSHVSLHEGVLDMAGMAKLRKALADAEA
jgi:hypothetical protein